MEKMFNPFLEGTEDEETKVTYILDKSLNCSREQKAVFRFLTFYLKQDKEGNLYKQLDIELNNLLGEQEYNFMKEIYFDTYNKETKTFSRYAYFEEKNDIRRIYTSFEEIYNNLGVFQNITKNI